jgi:hypothetical protein
MHCFQAKNLAVFVVPIDVCVGLIVRDLPCIGEKYYTSFIVYLEQCIEVLDKCEALTIKAFEAEDKDEGQDINNGHPS